MQLFGKSKYPFVQQSDEMDCGAACLAMISAHFGNPIPIHYWRDELMISRDGTSMLDLAQVADRHGIETEALQVESSSDLATLEFPMIALRAGHFMVLYEWKGNRILVGDPAVDVWHLTREEFDSAFEGFVLLLRPTQKFFEVKTTARATTPWLKQFFTQYPKQISLVFGLSLLISIGSVLPTLVSQKIIDSVSSPRLPTPSLQLWGIYSLAVSALLIIGSWMRNVLVTRASIEIDQRIGLDFFKKSMVLPFRFYHHRHLGDFSRRITELETVRQFFTEDLIELILSGVTIVVYSVLLFQYRETLAWTVLALSPLVVLVAAYYSRRIRQSVAGYLHHRTEQENSTLEFFSGIGTIKALNAEEAAIGRFDNALKKTLYLRRNFELTHHRAQAAVSGVSGAFDVFVLVLAALEVQRGGLSVGQMITVTVLAAGIIGPLRALTQSWIEIQHIIAVRSRLDDVLQTTPETESTHTSPGEPIEAGPIEFKNVYFRYGGEASPWVFEDLSLEIPAGSKVALVGPSGCGKSTLGLLLARFYQPSAGTITLNGKNLSDYPLKRYRDSVGFLMQEPLLFSGSIQENITFGDPDPDPERARQCAKLVNADEFISAKPGGYDYRLLYGGVGLSAGQKQRIALARILYRKPKILILDEATSSLDVDSETIIVDLIRNIGPECTVISIAHRPKTIQSHGDVIYFSRDGVKSAPHHKLLAENPNYRSIFE